MLAGLNAEHAFLEIAPKAAALRRPPPSGRQGLFVNQGFSRRIVELGASKRESAAARRQLFAHLARPGFSVRWRWKRGDLAFWDKRLTPHDATAAYLPQRRMMHRATLLGEVPYYRPGR